FAIALNAKTHRYGVCNAMETLLVDTAVAANILPRLAVAFAKKNVELRGCEQTRALISANEATEQDWDTEYLAPILSIKIVSGLDEAIDHIRRSGSPHTDAIVTEDCTRARRFLIEVYSNSLMINA